MRQMLIVATALLLVAGQVTAADDVKPAKPKVVKPATPDDVKPAKPKVVAVKLSQLEEEYETLEAHRDVKKAYVKAAHLSALAAEASYERTSKAFASGAITKEESEQAKLNVELAKAQVEIRIAELKEVEVKVKFAKKRLDEAKESSDKRK